MEVRTYCTFLLLVLLGIVSCQSKETEQSTDEASALNKGQSAEIWSNEELTTLESLWLGSLMSLPEDPGNKYGDDPDAAALGQAIFFDPRFSGNGEISCATCHIPQLMFTDGLPRAEAIGTTSRHTPSIVGAAYSPWFFWDGRRDSQWAQALAPLEDPLEHGGTRTQYVQILADDPTYRNRYEGIFGPLADFSDQSRFPAHAGPVENEESMAAWEQMVSRDQQQVNQVYANMGKAIAAYERKILPAPSRFDEYVESIIQSGKKESERILSAEEIKGLRLFITEGNCVQCHNGPLLSNHGFHSVGVPTAVDVGPDIGRFGGAQLVLGNEFNCLGMYSDAEPDQCDELTYIKTAGQELMGAFKVPSLRNVAETAPYMHSGQFQSLSEVLDHYNRAESGPTGHSDLVPLGLTESEMSQLEAFLNSLSADLDVDPHLLISPPNGG